MTAAERTHLKRVRDQHARVNLYRLAREWAQTFHEHGVTFDRWLEARNV